MMICIGALQHLIAAPQDSVKRNWALLITPRFNTLNMAPVSGTIVNRHVNADITIVFRKNNLTMTLQNGADLEDRHSEMNFLLMNVRYKLTLSRQFSVSPFIAFYSEHKQEFIDRGSDANGGMFMTWNYRNVTIEGFALVVRLTHEKDQKESINRLEMKWKYQSVTLSGFVYHNARYFDADESVSIGFRMLMPELMLFNKVPVRTDVTGSFKVYQNMPTNSLSGVFLSLALPFSF
jgi:hypothetical protein